MNKLTYFIILLLFVGIGCKDKVVPGKGPDAQKTATAGPAASATVQQEGPKVEKEVYVYDPKGRRDPFLSLVQVSKPRLERKKGASPIENYDVDDIKLIAIVWDNQQYYAMITLPDKKSYTIRKGMTLGLYNGKVSEITKDTVLISEQVKDYRGQTKTKDTTLRLRKEEEE
jgi:type IV pilus assembly protein PilP